MRWGICAARPWASSISFQFLFAGALAYFLYGEVPRPVFYAAGALVVGGAMVVIHAMASTAEGEREAEAASTPEVWNWIRGAECFVKLLSFRSKATESGEAINSWLW